MLDLAHRSANISQANKTASSPAIAALTAGVSHHSANSSQANKTASSPAIAALTAGVSHGGVSCLLPAAAARSSRRCCRLALPSSFAPVRALELPLLATTVFSSLAAVAASAAASVSLMIRSHSALHTTTGMFLTWVAPQTYSCLRRPHSQCTATRFLHAVAGAHDPVWHFSGHRCPHGRSFGQRSRQESLSTRSEALKPPYSTQPKVSFRVPQWQGNCSVFSHGGQSPSWHGRRQRCVQCFGRGKLHARSHFPQPVDPALPSCWIVSSMDCQGTPPRATWHFIAQ